jgi:hypothetical protein
MSYTGSVPATPRATNWRDTAACGPDDVDAEIFHAGERDPQSTEQARTVCNRCISRTACLTNAYIEGDEWGIRAGLTPRQRNAHLRKADGNIARAVADALDNTAILLRQIYQQHAQPTGDGHVLWTDTRHFINVRGKPYTVHQLAWWAIHDQAPYGHVQRACDVEGCVAEACLTDRRMRDLADAARKKAAV